MFPQDTQSASQPRERRSRRSHKNSKDGCPNCRANRVKCSEDLPSCLQCTKKKYRCGYLDFPPDRLEYIRRKNDMLRRQNQTATIERNPPVAASPIPASLDGVPSQYFVPMPHPQQMLVIRPAYPPALPPPAAPSFSLRPEPLYYTTPVVQLMPASHTQGSALAPSRGPDYMYSHPTGYLPRGALPPQMIPYHIPPGPSSAPQMVLSPPGAVMGAPMLAREPNPISHSFVSQAGQSEPQDMHRGDSSTLRPNRSSERIHTPGVTDTETITQAIRLRNSAGGDVVPHSQRALKENHVPHTNLHKTQKRRKRIRIRDSVSEGLRPSITVSTNFRSVVYSNAFRNITHDLGPLEKHMPSNFETWDEESSFALDPKNPFFDSDFQNDSFAKSEAREVLQSSEEPHSTASRITSEVSHARSITCPREPVTRMHTPDENFLPNCVFEPTKFKILEIPENLQNNLYAESVKMGTQIRFNTKLKMKYMPPIYHEREFRMLWVEIFLRATVFELFFIYFIDKSINILMRASEKIVNGDVVYSPRSSSSRSSSVSDTGLFDAKPLHFFYNKEDLDILTAKSYVTFGRVIAELRDSITLYSAEFSGRMSLFSAWACYTNPRSDLNTFSLMMRGTLSLFKNALTECISEGNSEFPMHREFSSCESFLRQAYYPDYNLSIIYNMKTDFERYKSCVDRLISLHEDGYDLDGGLISVIYDPIFRHDFHELNKMFNRLTDHYLQQISAQNDHFKSQKNYKRDPNIHFVSPSLLFELVYDWFYSYPDEKMYASSKINPLKKTMYMFYNALAKCLAHAITPLKSISFVDACNLTCTKVGMEFSKPDLLEEKPYASLQPILMNLMRTIRFLETRSRILGHHVFNRSVLDEDFVKAVPHDMTISWKYQDVMEILPVKLELHEKQVQNFSQTTFAFQNYPLLDELYADPVYADMIDSESERQRFALQNEAYKFNFELGLANHDFNPNAIVNLYCSKKFIELERASSIPHEQLSARLDMFLSSRDAISSCSSAAKESDV